MPGWVWVVVAQESPGPQRTRAVHLTEAFPTPAASQRESLMITALLKAFRCLSKTPVSKHCAY